MDYLSLILYAAGFLLAYAIILFRYKKELNLRLKWMNKRLKKGKWKFPLALFACLYLAITIINLIFITVSDNDFIKPFFISFCFVPLFIIFLFKFFYEIIGGKREWKL